MRPKGTILVVLVLVGAMPVILDAYAATATTSTASSSMTLGEQLQEKTQELNAINAALDAAKQSLNATHAQRVTLQSQLQSINNNISTLNLGIQADTVSSEQLALEVQQLTSDLGDITQSVGVRQAAIGAILQEIQRNDATNGSLLALFLKSGTLADGVLEANSILDLQAKLGSDITALQNLHAQYEQNITDSNAKQGQIVAHQADLESKKAIVKDQQQEKQSLLTATKDQESLFQKQYTALQKEQQQIANDIESLDAILRQKVNPATLPALHAGVLLVPIAGDTENNITQGYGATAFAKNGYQGHWHNGIDLAASVGTPVFAAEDGTIVAAGNQDAYCYKGAYGKFIVINHTDGLTTLYGHLSRQVVLKGNTVKRGQLIGYSGSTGYATGPHLHFTVYAQTTFYMGPSKTCGPMPYGGDLNPIGYLF